ncbi:hypothetical protein [Saccharopolyspora shandongensis]|uniref:hypothetical protein n=1 Tax=Saccharopolyspora shandongensis TaxID=418495 RepID=UPI0033E78CEE
MANKADAERAKDLSSHTGMKHIDALAYVVMTRNSPAIRHRWLISDDVRAWLNGETWRSCYYENLYNLMNSLRPDFECDQCYEDANAAGEDCTVEFVVTKYAPDIRPRTENIAIRKYHARCKPTSAITWAGLASIDFDYRRGAFAFRNGHRCGRVCRAGARSASARRARRRRSPTAAPRLRASVEQRVARA